MKSYATHPLAQLRKDRAHILDELAKVSPLLVKDLNLIELMIRAAEEGVEATYSKITQPGDAVETCLKLHGGWMTKPQITNALIQGGYSVPAELMGATVGDVVKYHGKDGGRLARDGEWVGLSEWIGDREIGKIT